MKTDERKLLQDILLSIQSIDDHLDSKKIFDEYQTNKTRRRAVERELEIIGEAINRLLKTFPEINLSYKRQIVDLRYKVIHSYDSVDDVIIWNVIVNHLPILKAEIEALI